MPAKTYDSPFCVVNYKAVSFFLPKWEDNVGYEKGEARVIGSMKAGYPRFSIHKSIQRLAAEVVNRFGVPEDGQSKEDLTAMLFPSVKTATVCADFMKSKLASDYKSQQQQARQIRILGLYMSGSGSSNESSTSLDNITSDLFCVIYPKKLFGLAKQVWQHTGQGISSRRSEFCLKALESGYLSTKQKAPCGVDCWAQKGPKRYQRNLGAISPSFSDSNKTESTEFDLFVEERFGRNLDITLANQAKLAVRRRIAGSLTAANVELDVALKTAPSEARIAGLTEDDVYLYPSGMNAIFNIHQTLLKARGDLKSICYGFPYIDTLKILQKWGPGAIFYGHCSDEELDEFEGRLESGERYLALFMEFPGNPLLKTPNIKRIRALADKYDFAVVIDESLGNYVNVNVLPYTDVVASSLTKVFSGDSNVMGGSAVLNPNGRYYKMIKEVLAKEFEDNYWAEDAIFLERNSRDFVSRIHRINAATVAMVEQLRDSPLGMCEFKCIILLEYPSPHAVC